MYKGLVTLTMTDQWELVREDVRHPADNQRCDLIRNKATRRYCTTDGTTIRSISQAQAREMAQPAKS